ncbi:MAG: hypothetical protein K2Z81_07510 [Cyanobacteria bacterium]|nr:hypothetical protein [Cyanobacteriota bacterium]
MSNCFQVKAPQQIPDDLKEIWETKFADAGFDVEIHSFDPSTWKGGFLPISVKAVPPDLDADDWGLVQLPNTSGFEIFFDFDADPEEIGESFAELIARGPTETILAWIGAATLADACGGQYIDAENDYEEVDGVNAVGRVKAQLTGSWTGEDMTHHPNGEDAVNFKNGWLTCPHCNIRFGAYKPTLDALASTDEQWMEHSTGCRQWIRLVKAQELT